MKNFIPKTRKNKLSIAEIVAGCRTIEQAEKYRLENQAKFAETVEERIMAERDLEEIYEIQN